MPRFSAPLSVVYSHRLPNPSSSRQRLPDRFQINHDIRIQPDEKVADVTCIDCSVHVRGQYRAMSWPYPGA